MEEKQLDLNAPLLSVRRLATTNSNPASPNAGRKPRPIRQQSLPATKSHWEPEQVTKPAAIPFIWEQIPGLAKHPKTTSSHITPSNDDQSSEDLQTDALDTLSISFSCNYCETNSETESITPFCSDIQTRDYLMNRFLPAAKSMIVETPQYVAKKQEATIPEPPKYERKVYSGELRPLLLEKYPVSVHNHENGGESVVVDDSKKKKKGLGFGFLVPRICAKRCSWLSNQMPGSGAKTKVHQSQSPVASSPGPVPRLSRRSSYSGPLTPSLEKQAMDAVIKKRAESQSKEVNETGHKPNPLTRAGNSLPSSPHHGLSRISPYRNESPRSPFHDGAWFLGVPKHVQNQIVPPKPCPSLNVKSHFSPRLIYDSPPVAPAKTLYIYSNDKSTNEAKIETNGDVDGSVPVPPLPKSPSESWLSRKMSLRSPFPKKMQQVTTEQGPKSGPKWETIVKTSNIHHDHARYSEELLNVSKYTEVSF